MIRFVARGIPLRRDGDPPVCKESLVIKKTIPTLMAASKVKPGTLPIPSRLHAFNRDLARTGGGINYPPEGHTVVLEGTIENCD